MSTGMEGGMVVAAAASPFILSFAALVIAIVCNLVRQLGAEKRPWQTAITRESILGLTGGASWRRSWAAAPLL